MFPWNIGLNILTIERINDKSIVIKLYNNKYEYYTNVNIICIFYFPGNNLTIFLIQ